MSSQSELRYDGRVAIITGAGAGMGREHCILLASRGAKIVLNDINKQAAEQTVSLVEKAGSSAVAVVGSIAERVTAEALVNTAIDKWGRIDILINNAGVCIKKPFDEFQDSDLSLTLGVHFWGSWWLTQLAWPHFKKAKYGRVLNVCSSSLFGMPSNAAYISAKGALYGLVRALAVEGPEHGILVNGLGPSAFTEMAKIFVTDESTHENMKALVPAWTPSAVVGYLVHEDTTLNGEFISSYGYSVGRIFLGETKGSFNLGSSFTPEIVRDNLDKSLDMTDYIVPKTNEEEVRQLLFHRT